MATRDYTKLWVRHDIPMKWHDHLHRCIGIIWLCMRYEVTANAVTVGRALLLLPVIVLAGYGLFKSALVLYILSWWGDAIDGSVARERLRRGYPDDEDFGAFLDPMVDKGGWGLTTLMSPIFVTLIAVTAWVRITGAWVTVTLLIIEAVLAFVRVQDFRNNRQSTDDDTINLRARGAGKVKMICEAVGLGALIGASDSIIGGEWCYHLWVWSLSAAIPLALMSLAQKLWARR